MARGREFVRVALHDAPELGQGAGPIGQAHVRLDVGAGPRLNQVTVTGTHYRRSVEFYCALGLKQIVDNPPDYARFETAGGATFSVQIDPEEKIVATTAVYLECDDLDDRVEQLARSESHSSTAHAISRGCGARRASATLTATSSSSIKPAKPAASRRGEFRTIFTRRHEEQRKRRRG